jgi:quinol monooxygenase YgiN
LPRLVYAEDVLDVGLIRVTEMWRDQVALDRHFRSDHIAAWRAAWPALGLGDRDLRKFEVGEAEPT